MKPIEKIIALSQSSLSIGSPFLRYPNYIINNNIYHKKKFSADIEDKNKWP